MKYIFTLVTFLRWAIKLKYFNYNSLYQNIGLKIELNEYLVQSRNFNRGKQYVKSFGILGLSFEKFINRKLTTLEFESIILLGHLAPIFDDFFDKIGLSRQRIVELVCNPNEAQPKNEEEELFMLFYKPLHRSQKTNKSFLKNFLLLIDAQEESKRQGDVNVSLKCVDTITRNKGGCSMLLLRSLINEPLKENEEGTFYRLGALSQYMDDIFYWYEDTLECRKTVANKKSLIELDLFYNTKFDELLSEFSGTSFYYPFKVLFSPAFVCLDSYKEKDLDTLLKPLHSKNVFVCDMEKMGNVLNLLFKAK